MRGSSVAPSSPRRRPARVVAIAALAATLVLVSGCAGALYPGVARTRVTYYDSQGRISAVVEHTTSWRQARVAAPMPMPELQPLEAHSEEYALALTELYNRENGAADPTPTASQALDPVQSVVEARMLWIDHQGMSGGLEGAWGAFLGFITSALPALL